MLLSLDTELYAPETKHSPEWRPTVAEVIATSTRQEALRKQMGLPSHLTLADVADRLTLYQLQVLANDWRLTVCG